MASQFAAKTSPIDLSSSSADNRNRRTGFAWLLLCLALALHVIDEASTGFLDVYNPTVIALREKVSWMPLFTFDFKVWLTGLVVAVTLLSILSIFAFRGAHWIRYLAYLFSILMIANALLHTIGTIFGHTVRAVRFARPMPGFYSSPFLLVASFYLLYQLRQSATVRSYDNVGVAVVVVPQQTSVASSSISPEKNKRAQL